MIRDDRPAAVTIGAAVRSSPTPKSEKRAGSAISHSMSVERILRGEL